MGTIVHTRDYRVQQESYIAHPRFTASLRSVEKALVRNAWIQGDLTTFGGILCRGEKFFEEPARVADFERLYFAVGIFAHCKEERRYYFDHEVAAMLKDLVRNGQRLPTYKGDVQAQLAKLKEQAIIPKMRDRIASLVLLKHTDESVLPDETVSNDTEPPALATSEVSMVSAHGPTLADALSAIELIESEGSRKGVYVVDEHLIFEIRDALLGQAIAPDYTAEVNELRTELLTARALSEAAHVQAMTAHQEQVRLQQELEVLRARERQDVASVLSELKSLPDLFARVEHIVSSKVSVPVAAEPTPFKVLLQQQYDGAVREHDRLKSVFDDRNKVVQRHAADLEEVVIQLQSDFSLTPEQVTEKQLKQSAPLRKLYDDWMAIRETITAKRKQFELESLEEKISEISTLVRALKTVLAATPAK